MRSKSSEFSFLGPVGGKVSQVIGPVIDIRYKGRSIPDINTAIEIMDSSSSKLAKYVQVVAEVQQMIGGSTVRTIAMNPTEGLARNFIAVDTGKPILPPFLYGANKSTTLIPVSKICGFVSNS